MYLDLILDWSFGYLRKIGTYISIFTKWDLKSKEQYKQMTTYYAKLKSAFE